MMKKALIVLMVFILLIPLAACSEEPDPNAGKYMGIKGEMMGITMSMEELYPGESYLELKNGGKAVLVLEGEKMDCEWSLDGETFHLIIEGQSYPGTLKDGIVEFDFGGIGMILTFAKEGVTVPTDPTLEAGYYAFYAMEQDGEYTDNDTIIMAGADKENYILVYEDGTADIVMDGETYTCLYRTDCFVDDEGFEIKYGIVDGLVELYLEGNLTFYYKKGNVEDVPTVDPDAMDAAFPEDIVEEFYGDWHGWCVITDGTGAYESDVDGEFELLARYAFDAAGNCTPWMAIYSDPEDNFQNVSLAYSENEYCTYLSGQLFGMDIQSSSYIYESSGSLCMFIDLADEEGTLQIIVTMRHLDDEWDEYDYPCMPKNAQDYYAGMTFEELVMSYELDPADLPELN